MSTDLTRSEVTESFFLMSRRMGYWGGGEDRVRDWRAHEKMCVRYVITLELLSRNGLTMLTEKPMDKLLEQSVV